MSRLEVELKELVEVKNGSTPSTNNPEFYDGDISWITPKDLSIQKSKYVFRGERNITANGLKSCSATIIPSGSILMSSRAPIGLLAIAGTELCTNQGFKNFVVKGNKINNEYLFYYIKTRIKDISELGTGTTFKEVSKSVVEALKVNIESDINFQQKIAKVLSDLDTKIELNSKINAELEAMAKLIYDYWFVQFDFPHEFTTTKTDEFGKVTEFVEVKPYKSSGGKMVWNEELKREIPEGWEVSTLSTWIKNDKSGDWGKESEQGNYVERVFCLRGADLNGLNGKGEVKAPDRFILEKNKHKILDPYDLVIEISGGSPTQSTGRMAYITPESLERFEAPIICSNFCKAVTLKNEKSLFNFAFEWNRAYDHGVLFGFEGKTSGIKNLLFESFVTNYSTPIPPEKLMEKFHDFMTPIEARKQKNLKENQKLAELRDWLLPMLMNGQVTVTNAKRQVKEVVKETRAATLKNDTYSKIQLLYTTIWANQEIDVKQGEMATAKDVYLLDRIYGIPTGFQFAQHNWGSFDPEEKKLLNTKQYFHKPNFPNSKAIYLGLKDEGKLLQKIPSEMKDQVSEAIREMNAKVFNRYFGTQKAEKKELFATVLKCIEDRKSLDLAVIREEMANWKIKQGGKESTKAEKFSEADTKEALEMIVREKWFERVIR